MIWRIEFDQRFSSYELWTDFQSWTFAGYSWMPLFLSGACSSHKLTSLLMRGDRYWYLYRSRWFRLGQRLYGICCSSSGEENMPAKHIRLWWALEESCAFVTVALYVKWHWKVFKQSVWRRGTAGISPRLLVDPLWKQCNPLVSQWFELSFWTFRLMLGRHLHLVDSWRWDESQLPKSSKSPGQCWGF